MDKSEHPKHQRTLDDLLCEVPLIPHEVEYCWPHDPNAFTEGLVFYDGTFYESTGPYPPPHAISTLRQVEIKTGRILRCHVLRTEYFAEGLTIFSGKIFQLTFRSKKGFVYDLETFNLIDAFCYQTEGWGLTNDGQCLIMSDGTDKLRLIDPDSLEIVREPISVHIGGEPLSLINELEYIDDSIYANVLGRDSIFRIDPKSGEVCGRIELTDLRPPDAGNSLDLFLNGIAYEERTEHLFVTGKNWPTLYEISLSGETA